MRDLTRLADCFIVVPSSCSCRRPSPPRPAGSRMDQVLDAAIANERELAATLESHRPVVETYLQTVKPDPVMGVVPVRDNYFFGRLELASTAAPARRRRPRSRRRRSTCSRTSTRPSSSRRTSRGC